MAAEFVHIPQANYHKTFDRLVPLLNAYWLAASTLTADGGGASAAHVYEHSETTDPRDSVFAQKNINPSLRGVEPRYQDSLVNVLMDATLTALQTTRIWHYFAPPKHFESVNVPSWVIDFTSAIMEEVHLESTLYNSALGATIRVRFEEADSLVTAAFLTSPVCEVCHEAQLSPAVANSFLQSLGRISMAANFLSEKGGMAGMTSESTISRTICADSKSNPSERRCNPADLSALHTVVSRAQKIMSSSEGSDQTNTTNTLDEVFEQKGLSWIDLVLRYFAIGVTEEGRNALLPELAVKGDAVAILAGSSVPMILRESGTRSGRTAYRRIGVAYVYGQLLILLLQDWINSGMANCYRHHGRRSRQSQSWVQPLRHALSRAD